MPLRPRWTALLVLCLLVFSPAEAFIRTPGMFVDNRRNVSLSGGVRFAIRQPLPRFGMRGIQLLQDGVPMTMADGTTEPTNIDLATLGTFRMGA